MTVVSAVRRLNNCNAVIYNCNSTTIRLRCIAYACFQSDASKYKRLFFVVVISQLNQTHIVISITSVVVECVVVSLYSSRIVVELQLIHKSMCAGSHR